MADTLAAIDGEFEDKADSVAVIMNQPEDEKRPASGREKVRIVCAAPLAGEQIEMRRTKPHDQNQFP